MAEGIAPRWKKETASCRFARVCERGWPVWIAPPRELRARCLLMHHIWFHHRVSVHFAVAVDVCWWYYGVLSACTREGCRIGQWKSKSSFVVLRRSFASTVHSIIKKKGLFVCCHTYVTFQPCLLNLRACFECIMDIFELLSKLHRRACYVVLV